MNKLILEALSVVGAPAAYLDYDGFSVNYITFFEYNQYGVSKADDDETFIGHFYQLDIFTKGNNLEIVKNVKKAMKDAGFGNRTFEFEEYIPETKQYHKLLRFTYVRTNEEE